MYNCVSDIEGEGDGGARYSEIADVEVVVAVDAFGGDRAEIEHEIDGTGAVGDDGGGEGEGLGVAGAGRGD